jgi:hypothetical protein
MDATLLVVQVIMLAVAKCDRLAAVPQLLLSFEEFLRNTGHSRAVSTKVACTL